MSKSVKERDDEAPTPPPARQPAERSGAVKARPLFDPPIVKRAALAAVAKLDPRHLVRNPVMFTVLVGSVLTTGLGLRALAVPGSESPAFILGVSAWLWFTVLFANFAEAMAEGRGKAQAATLRKTRAWLAQSGAAFAYFR